MARYFKAYEISEEEFEDATGDDIDGYCQVVVPTSDGVYVAIDDEQHSDIQIGIDLFEYEEEEC